MLPAVFAAKIEVKLDVASNFTPIFTLDHYI